MKEIYLAGGCFWGVEAVFSRLPGVISTSVGYADSKIEAPSYEEVCSGAADAAETVRVEYDPNKTDLMEILRVFFAVIDPYAVDRQGNDCGRQYRTGVYYTQREDEAILEHYFNFLQQRGQKPAVTDASVVINEEPDALRRRKMVTELKRLDNFYPAEEAHQKYLDKNPQGYCHIDLEALRKAGIIR